MVNNLNEEIQKSYTEIEKIHDEVNDKIYNFITKANELVELSEDDYQIEKTLKLNKISLKGYVLDSECCISLKESNINNYSIEELKHYLTKYNSDYSKYLFALSLYELIEDIEEQVDKKISLEINVLSNIISNIDSIRIIKNEEYERLYYDIKNQLDNDVKNKRIDAKTYNICIQILNDIFNFYISGYPNIPDEYLYHEES